jgi:hypothetical protein
MGKPIESRLLSRAEDAAYCVDVPTAGRLLGKDVQWTRHLMREGRLPAVRKNGKLFTTQMGIEGYKSRRTGRPKLPAERRTVDVHIRLNSREFALFGAAGGQDWVRRCIAAFGNDPAILRKLEEDSANEIGDRSRGLADRDNPNRGAFEGEGVRKFASVGGCTFDSRTQEEKDADPQYGRPGYFAPGYDDHGKIAGLDLSDVAAAVADSGNE